MDAEALQAIGTIIGSVLLVVGGGWGAHRWRRGKAETADASLLAQQQQQEPMPPQPSAPQLQGYPQRHVINTMAPGQPIDPAEDTGRFVVAMQNAPPAVLEDMARSLRDLASQKPATRADVKREADSIRGEFSEFRERVSESVLDVRDDVQALRDDIQSLPCRSGSNGDGNCDVIEVPVTMPPRRSPEHLRRVKP
jgi:hypothetical protein